MKDKKMRRLLMGKMDLVDDLETRRITVTYPSKDDMEKEVRATFAGDDGLILHLLRRIEALEGRKK